MFSSTILDGCSLHAHTVEGQQFFQPCSRDTEKSLQNWKRAFLGLDLMGIIYDKIYIYITYIFHVNPQVNVFPLITSGCETIHAAY